MKKTYQTPATELVGLVTAGIIAASIHKGDDYSGNLGDVEAKRNAIDDEDFDDEEEETDMAATWFKNFPRHSLLQ